MNLHRRIALSATFALIGAPFVLAAAACGDEHGSEHSTRGGLFESMTPGSGTIASRTRELPAFSTIKVDGSTDVDIRIGSPQTVSVIGDDNLLDLIDLHVSGERLVIGSHGSYRSRHGLKVSVQMPAITAVDIEGSGDVALHGVDGGKLKLQIEGSGDIQADGVVDELALSIAGSGDAQLQALSAKTATVAISGSGDASEALSAVTNGSGDLSYSGDPAQLSVSSHGSGDIRKR